MEEQTLTCEHRLSELGWVRDEESRGELEERETETEIQRQSETEREGRREGRNSLLRSLGLIIPTHRSLNTFRQVFWAVCCDAKRSEMQGPGLL